MAEDVLDIILRLSNLQKFVAGARTAAGSVAGIGDATVKANEKAAASSSKLAGVAGMAGKGAMAGVAAVAAIGYESVKKAIEFDKQMQMIHTQAGASATEVTRMSKAVLTLDRTGQYAQGPITLAQGLFHLESIGLRGARALNALKLASQGAAVGNADLEQTTTALGSAWLAGIRGGTNLHTVMAALNATVGAGNMRMQSLVDSLGTGVLPAAKIAGLGLKDVMSALAVLSDEGYHGYSAMAQFATSLHFIYDPGTKAAGALHSIGLAQFQLAETIRKHGLDAALIQLHQHLLRLGPLARTAVMGDILPAGRGRVLEVLMNQANRLQFKFKQISANQKNFAEDVAATHRTAAFRIHAAWAMIEADMIIVGHALEPVAVAFAQGTAILANGLLKIPNLISNFVHWFDNAGGSVGKFRVAAGSTFTFLKNIVISVWHTMEAFGQGIARQWHAVFGGGKGGGGSGLGADLESIGEALLWFMRTVGSVFKWIIQKALPPLETTFGGVFRIIKGAIEIVAGLLTLDFAKAFKGVESIVSGAAHILSGAVRLLIIPFQGALTLIGRAVGGIWHVVSSLPGKILHAFVSVQNALWNAITWPFRSAFNWVKSHLPHFHNVHIGPISIPLPSFQHGGTMLTSGFALVGETGPEVVSLPRGAQVRPMRTSMPSAGSIMSDFTPNFLTILQVDRKEIARAAGKYVDDKRARR